MCNEGVVFIFFVCNFCCKMIIYVYLRKKKFCQNEMYLILNTNDKSKGKKKKIGFVL